MVARLLERAFDEASKLSEEDQRELAEWILMELESDNRWTRAFADSEDRIAELAEEALGEDIEGQTKDLDPMELWSLGRLLDSVGRTKSSPSMFSNRPEAHTNSSSKTPVTRAFDSRQFILVANLFSSY